MGSGPVPRRIEVATTAAAKVLHIHQSLFLKGRKESYDFEAKRWKGNRQAALEKRQMHTLTRGRSPEKIHHLRHGCATIDSDELRETKREYHAHRAYGGMTTECAEPTKRPARDSNIWRRRKLVNRGFLAKPEKAKELRVK